MKINILIITAIMTISNHLSYPMEGYIDIQNNTMTEYFIATQFDRDMPIKLDQKLMANNIMRFPIQASDMNIDLTENNTNPMSMPNLTIATVFTDNDKSISIAVDQSFEPPLKIDHVITTFEEIARKRFDITKSYPNVLIVIEEETKGHIFKKALIKSKKRSTKKAMKKAKVDSQNKKILTAITQYKYDPQYLISLKRS